GGVLAPRLGRGDGHLPGGAGRVLVVGGDVAGVDPLDAADELEVVVPQPGPPGQQLVGLGADQADAVAVLVGDLAAGVDDQQPTVVVGELELLRGEHDVECETG